MALRASFLGCAQNASVLRETLANLASSNEKSAVVHVLGTVTLQGTQHIQVHHLAQLLSHF